MTGYVRARVIGGFGHQLFIYATALHQARRLKSNLVLDVTHYQQRSDFACELGSFAHSGVFDEAAPAARPAKRRWRGGAAPADRAFTEQSFAYDPRIDEIATGTTLTGYFQSWRYFEQDRELIVEQLHTPSSATPWLDAWTARLRGQAPICLHVRRGDYTAAATAAVHGLSTPDYFERSVRLLRGLGHDGPLVLFSDDPGAASVELAGLGQLLVVDNTGTPYETLRLMSLGEALVMSNSSFSWWAAWLGEKPDRPVIAPRPWFNDTSLDTRDLLMPGWLTLERRELGT